MARKFILREASVGNAAADRGFEMPLPTVVRGEDSGGAAFEETTVLTYMSARMAAFELGRRVDRDARLKLIISLPPKLSADSRLKLVINGRVALVASGTDGKVQVSLTLEDKYIIKPEG